jgi:biopolymer transport protein TolQ
MTLATPSIIDAVLNAGPVVKAVMLILLATSVCSWSLIFQRKAQFKHTKKGMKSFEKEFWSGDNLATLFKKYPVEQQHTAFAEIFASGFNEYQRLEQCHQMSPEARIENIERAMRITTNEQIESLEKNLNILATIGSVSPFIGLFGTVWGIMNAFTQLSGAQQASIAMVAPGISEALIATAIGLFAAIPAVIAFNRYTHTVDVISQKMENFGENLIKILHRDIHS